MLIRDWSSDVCSSDLVREKAHTHAGDELAAARRRLPMTPMEPVMVAGPNGPLALNDVFEGRRILIVYHFMWKQGAPQHKQCEGCTGSEDRRGGKECVSKCRSRWSVEQEKKKK